MRYKKILPLVMTIGFMFYGVADALTITLTAPKGSGDWVSYQVTPTGLTASCQNYNNGRPYRWQQTLIGRTSGDVVITDGQTKTFKLPFPDECGSSNNADYWGFSYRRVSLSLSSKENPGCYIMLYVNLDNNNVSNQVDCGLSPKVTYSKSNDNLSIILN